LKEQYSNSKGLFKL